MEIHYGWFSQKQSEVGGTSVWKTPEGSAVLVTCLTNGPEHGCDWDDIKFVSLVTEPIRTEKRGWLTELMDLELDEPFDDDHDFDDLG